MRKIFNFCRVNSHNTTLQWFYDSLYQYLQSVRLVSNLDISTGVFQRLKFWLGLLETDCSLGGGDTGCVRFCTRAPVVHNWRFRVPSHFTGFVSVIAGCNLLATRQSGIVATSCTSRVVLSFEPLLVAPQISAVASSPGLGSGKEHALSSPRRHHILGRWARHLSQSCICIVEALWNVPFVILRRAFWLVVARSSRLLTLGFFFLGMSLLLGSVEVSTLDTGFRNFEGHRDIVLLHLWSC